MKSSDIGEAAAITPMVLRDWPPPEAGDSKYGRGQMVVLGGARKSPGAAMLAGLASLRVGAGRLTLAVAASVATQVGVAVPESGVVSIDEDLLGNPVGAGFSAAKNDLEQANAVLAGPGLGDADETVALLEQLPGLASDEAVLVLDAFAIGVLPRVPTIVDAFGGRLVLTPNKSEAARLLDRELGDELADIAEIASRYRAVVSCYGLVAGPGGDLWKIGSGNSGLGTSGSGDVLAGAVAGLAARGTEPLHAAAWATHLHAMAGDRLAARIAPLGYLARELLDELPLALRELES